VPDKRDKLRAKRNRGVIQPRNTKLYVDEDVEDWAVEELRTIKLNVKTGRWMAEVRPGRNGPTSLQNLPRSTYNIEGFINIPSFI
jgi:hypothetical protein